MPAPGGRPAACRRRRRLPAIRSAQAPPHRGGLFAVERKRPLPGTAAHRRRHEPDRRGVARHPADHRAPRPAHGAHPLARAGAGVGAVESLIAALDGLAQIRDLDVVILARGGGAAEDLAPSTTRRSSARSCGSRARSVPGVGHETDVTLADLAADVRAPTPSAAAELVVPDSGAEQMRRRARGVASPGASTRADRRAAPAAGDRAADARSASPGDAAAVRRQRIDEARRTLDRAIALRSRSAAARGVRAAPSRGAFAARGARPRLRDRRGSDGHIRASVATLKTGDRVRVRMRDGRAGALVETVERNG